MIYYFRYSPWVDNRFSMDGGDHEQKVAISDEGRWYTVYRTSIPDLTLGNTNVGYFVFIDDWTYIGPL